MAALRARIDASEGYPTTGRRPDGSPGPGWTMMFAEAVVADDGEHELDVHKLSERSRHLIAGLPMRKHKPRPEPKDRETLLSVAALDGGASAREPQ